MFKFVLFGLLVVHQAAGVIHRLTRLEYEKLPPLVYVDDYGRCMHAPGDVYCFAKLQLHGNLSDPLYNTIVEYSANKITHFDHTLMHRGVCPKHSCQQYMNTTSNLTEVIEACLNDTITKQYKLTSKVVDINCEHYKEDMQLDASDYAFVILVLILLGLNIAGSLYDFQCPHGKDTTGGKILLSFSVRENWRRLVEPANNAPMLRRIKSIYAFKSMTSILVVLAHSPVPVMLVGNDPHYIEQTYHNLLFQILYNGTLAVQTFFIISAFLLAYNTFRSEEKRPPRWQNCHRNIIQRWLRLTPVYGLVTFYVMTWSRHFGFGPFYSPVIKSDADSCRQDWWRHLLYIHNYSDGSQCMAHTWYLAADFQLYVVGLMVFNLLYSHRARKLAIGAMLFIGIITPAVHTYVQNLHAVLIPAPEVILNYFVNDSTFNNLYKRGHTNISGFALGLGFAYIVNNLKESDIGAQKYKKYRILNWLMFPLLIGVALVGYMFYIDGLVIPLGVRAVYSSVIKVVFSLVMMLFVFFTIVKVERAQRGVLNWSGWVPISRLSYCAYVVHVPILRLMASTTDVLVHGSFAWQLQNFFSILAMSYLVACLLFILLEAPMGEWVRLLMKPAPRKNTKPEKVADNGCSKETIEVKL